MKKSIIIRKRKKSRGFNPNREEILRAQEEFLNRGGKITFLKPDGNQISDLTKDPEKSSYADEFLLESEFPSTLGVDKFGV